jgi:hypothetical protein
MLGWFRYGFNKKRDGTRYVEHVFLHPMGYGGHIAHFGSTGMQNIDALFLMLGWPLWVSIKSAPGHAMLNLYFCTLWDL